MRSSPWSQQLRTVLLLVGCLALALLLAATLAPMLAPRRGPGKGDGGGIRPFSLADVELLEGSEYLTNMEVNLRFMMMLDIDRLAYNFRATAGLPAPGEPFGGWESPSVEVRGQFMGHWMSAMAFAYKNTGDEKYRLRAAEFVDALRECQDAHGDGYLSAFPSEHFERLEALQPVWAPYYVIHKLMAGLLDQHQLAGNPHALPMLKRMARYFCDRVENVVTVNGTEHWEQVLNTEFGGMNEVLYNLYLETGKERYRDCAHRFDKPAFYQPLVEGRDALAGLHANTHLAQINGFAARYEATGDEEAAAAVRAFFSIALSNHSFSTGGNNWFEGWHAPHTLGDAVYEDVNAWMNTEESCTQYNMLKIARRLFRWTGDAALADYYERAILNDVIGIQHLPPDPANPHLHSHSHSHPHPHSHGLPRALGAAASGAGHMHPAPARLPDVGVLAPGGAGAVDAAAMAAAYAAQPRPDNYQVVSWPDDPGRQFRSAAGPSPTPGVYIYYLPLGAGNSKGDSRGWTHGWGDPYNTFWCCYGTAVESFSKLADSIYFHRMPGPAVGPAPASPGGTAGDLPELFVNQLVSSELQWRELGARVRMEADIYGPDTTALATLRLAMKGRHDRAGTRRFVLNWRIPAWADERNMSLWVNGKATDACSQGAREATAAAEGGDNTARPAYGRGARFCALGPEWADGDTVEVRLPMRYVVEDLNDDRPAMQALKAIMMGPLMMAGLTNDTRELDADPDRISESIRVPDTEGLVSLQAAGGGGGGRLLRHQPDGTVALGPQEEVAATRAAAMDATFRLAPPLAGGGAGAGVGSTPAVLVEAGAGGLLSLESMSRPGLFLAAAPQGGLELRRLGSAAERLAATFARHAVHAAPGRGEEAAEEPEFLLEALSAPGVALRLPAGGHLISEGPTALRLAAPAAPAYPRGARIVQGATRSYLLVPIGQIQDEFYTAYFNFTLPAPSS